MDLMEYEVTTLHLSHTTTTVFLNQPAPASFSLFSSFQYKVCRWLDSNRGPLVSEATAMLSEPQPQTLPKVYLFLFQIVFFSLSFILPFSLCRQSNFVLCLRHIFSFQSMSFYLSRLAIRVLLFDPLLFPIVLYFYLFATFYPSFSSHPTYAYRQ